MTSEADASSIAFRAETHFVDESDLNGDWSKDVDLSDLMGFPQFQSSGESASVSPSLTDQPGFLVSGQADDTYMAVHLSSAADEYGHMFLGATEDFSGQATSTAFLRNNGSLNMDPQWTGEQDFSESIEQSQQSSCIMNTEDWTMHNSNPTSQTTLILEDVHPDTLNSVMSTLFRSRTKFKMEAYQ